MKALEGNQRWYWWFGICISLLAGWRVLDQLDLDGSVAAWKSVNWYMVCAAVSFQLVVDGIMAFRWALFFKRRPRLGLLLRSVFIARLANLALPMRVGALVRAYMVGRSENQSQVSAFISIIAEKAIDWVAFALLLGGIVPVLAPGWLHWVSLANKVWLLIALVGCLWFGIRQRHVLLRGVVALHQRIGWRRGRNLLHLIERGLGALSELRGVTFWASLWIWTAARVAVASLVVHVMLRTFGIVLPFGVAVFVWVMIEFGNKVLPVTPLGGIGVYQLLCIESLSLFSVERTLALNFGLMLQFVVFVPGSVIGAILIYRGPNTVSGLAAAAKHDLRGPPSDLVAR